MMLCKEVAKDTQGKSNVKNKDKLADVKKDPNNTSC